MSESCEENVSVLASKVDGLLKRTEKCGVQFIDIRDKLEGLAVSVALARQEIKLLRSGYDSFGQKCWQIILVIVTALVGGFVGGMLS